MRKTRFGTAMLLLAAALGAAAAAETTPLRSFGGIMAAFNAGERVRAVFRYKDMKLFIEGREDKEIPDAVGGMDLSSFEYFAAGSIGNKEAFVTSSQTHLIRHARHGIVYNYVKVSIYESGLVRILAQYLSPGTYEVKMDETFVSAVNDGKNNAGAFFFRN